MMPTVRARLTVKAMTPQTGSHICTESARANRILQEAVTLLTTLQNVDVLHLLLPIRHLVLERDGFGDRNGVAFDNQTRYSQSDNT